MICRKLEECINGELQSNSLEKCGNKNRMNCIESSDRRSAVKCEENKKKYVFENTKKNHVILYITPAVKYRRFYLLRFPSAALVYALLRSVLNRCPLDI